ncbi:MAG: nucleoside hydrolase [Pirellulaceae bacterium]
MPRKIIVDSDMGTDDAAALVMLLFHSDLEILALTACEGCVSATQANNNLQSIVTQLDPPRLPRLGMASPTANAPAINTSFLYGADGLGNSSFPISEKQHLLPAEKVIIECVRKNPGDVTFLCLGPATNLANALRRDPAIAELLGQVVMIGGSVNGVGNISPMAEFNFFFDPYSARQIFHSRITKTLIPLDVTRQIQFGLDFLDSLPPDSTRAGRLLRKILPNAYRAYRQQLGQEAITLNDTVGSLAVIHDKLFEFEGMAGDVETDGELTRGVTVFDRRTVAEWRDNLEVATAIDLVSAKNAMAAAFRCAGELSRIH